MATILAKIAQKPAEIADEDAERAFEAAFTTHWSWVCATLYRLLGDQDEAEDMALEVFYRLHKSRLAAQPTDDDQTQLGSWLYRVTVNTGLNALRARKRRRHYEENAGRLALQRAAPIDPAAEVERREQQARVQQVLAQMKKRAAKILILRYSGLKYKEIAEILNIAPGSVGKLLARAEGEFERRYRALEEER